MRFATTVWNKVISDPVTGQQGQVWGAPISCYVESYTDTWNGATPPQAYIHNSVDPSNVGRFVTLYSGAAAYETIGDLGHIQRWFSERCAEPGKQPIFSGLEDADRRILQLHP